MSKEVKRYDPLLGLARNAKLRRMDMQCDPQWVLDLAAERDALLSERDALKAEQALWEPIHYEIHRRAEKQWCLSSQCDFEVTVTYEDYAAIDAALQGEQP